MANCLVEWLNRCGERYITHIVFDYFGQVYLQGNLVYLRDNLYFYLRF